MKECTDPTVGKDVLGYDSADEAGRAKLEEHIRECDLCRAELEGYQAAVEAMKLEAERHPSADDLFSYWSSGAGAAPHPEGGLEIEHHLLVCPDCQTHLEVLRAGEGPEADAPEARVGEFALDDVGARRFAAELARRLDTAPSVPERAAQESPPPRRSRLRSLTRRVTGWPANGSHRRGGRQGFPTRATMIAACALLVIGAAVALLPRRPGVTSPPVFRAPGSINLIAPDDGARVRMYQEFKWQVMGTNATYTLAVRDNGTREVVLQQELNETTYILNESGAEKLTVGHEYSWSVSSRSGQAEWRSPERRFVFEGRGTAVAAFTDFGADERAAFEKRYREAAQAELPPLQQKLEEYLRTHEGDETPDAAWAHQMLGSIFYRRDDRGASKNHYEVALRLWERLGIPDEVLYARTLGNYGLINQKAGNFEKALTLYHKSLAMYGDRDDKENLRRRGDGHLNTGTAYRELGLPDRAIEHYKAALKIDERQGNVGAMAEDLNNIGYLYVNEMDNPAKGLEFLTDSLAKHREAASQSGHPRDTMADTLDSLGVACARLGDVAGAEKYFSEAIALDTGRGHDTGLLQTTNHLAELSTDYETALGRYQDSLKIVGRSEDADQDEVWRTYDGFGRAYLTAGNLGEAEANLNKAIEILERMRGSLSAEEFRRTFRLERQSPYHNLARLRLRQSDLAGLFDAVESSRASTLRELKVARSGGTAAAPATLSQFQQALGEGDVALEYFFASRKAPVLLLAVTPGQANGYELSTREELDKLVKPLIRDLANGADLAVTSERLSELSRLLFPEQLLEQMRRDGAKRVLISPDGVLHHVPFDLLPVARPGGGTRYLLEWLVVSSTPSLRWWYETRAETARLNGKPRDMLVVADPAASDLGCEVESPIFKEILSSKVSFAALSSSRTEAEMVTSYGAHDSEMLVGDRATSQNLLKTQPADFKVIHFATHAVSGGTLLTSALVFGCQGRLDMLPGEVLKDLPLDGQLVVLSACDTGGGRDISGAGTDSLSYGFLMAGADVVIASRELVKDETPVPLMEAFYEHLSEGATVDEALRDAKLRLLHAGSEPAAWSSFTAVGYGDMKVPIRPALSVTIRQVLARHWGVILILVVVTCALAVVLSRRHKTRAAAHEPIS